jgi:hypothetical protein
VSAVETIVAERAGVLALAKRHCTQVDAMVARGTIAGDEATLLKERLRAFADQVAQGLHIETMDDRAVRAPMRAILKDQEKAG